MIVMKNIWKSNLIQIDELPLNKAIKIPLIVARAISLESNKYYLQVFLDDCLYEL